MGKGAQSAPAKLAIHPWHGLNRRSAVCGGKFEQIGMITVSIVEDERLTREALAQIIGGTDGFRCLGAHATAEIALKKIPRERPQVTLVDLGLPELSGVECVRQLRALVPDTKLIVLTKYEDATRIFEALQAGANGYVLKKTPPARLLEAIADVHSGGAPMSSEVAARVVAYFHTRGQTASLLTSLTAREQEILELLAKGLQYKEIAQALSISTATVRVHLRHTYEKLHVRSRTEAVVKLLGR